MIPDRKSTSYEVTSTHQFASIETEITRITPLGCRRGNKQSFSPTSFVLVSHHRSTCTKPGRVRTVPHLYVLCHTSFTWVSCTRMRLVTTHNWRRQLYLELYQHGNRGLDYWFFGSGFKLDIGYFCGGWRLLQVGYRNVIRQPYSQANQSSTAAKRLNLRQSLAECQLHRHSPSQPLHLCLILQLQGDRVWRAAT